MKDIKGKFSSGAINKAVIGIVLLVILFALYAVLVPEAQTAGDSMNDSNLCAANSCSYNDSRTVVCTATNTSGTDVTACATASSIPLANLLNGTGVVFVVIMAALLIVVIKAFITKGKK